MNEDALKAAREHNPRQPGKFEGEDAATVYYWYCMLDGDGDYDCTCGARIVTGWECNCPVYFDVTPDEAKEFGLIHEQYVLETSSTGFVFGAECGPKAE